MRAIYCVHRRAFLLSRILAGALALISPVLVAQPVQAQSAKTPGTATPPQTCAAVIATAIDELQVKANKLLADPKPDLATALEALSTFANKVKNEVLNLCTVDKEIAILQQAKETYVDTTAEGAKLNLDVCRHKMAALSDFLRRYFGWLPPDAENELKIVNAVFGDLRNQRRFPRIRQTCDATPHFKQSCGAGSTYCPLTFTTLKTEVCGFDPSPYAADENKAICVTYTCGASRRRGCWPSNTTKINLVCSYPPKVQGGSRTAAEIAAALEQEREFFSADPCPVNIPQKRS